MLIGRNPVDATLMMRTPISDPDVDARVSGKVDLADVRRTVKMEGVDQLAGTIAADAAVRTRMSAVDKKQYDKVNASGSLDVAGLTVKGKALPQPLAIQQASLTLAPQKADLTAVRRHSGQQRPPGVGHDRESPRLRHAGRYASRRRDGAEQQVQPR